MPKNKAGNDKVILEDDFLSETAYERGFNMAKQRIGITSIDPKLILIKR